MKEKPYNIVRNLIYSSVSTSTAFLLFILMSFVGRYLGETGYGTFMVALAFTTIFEMFTDFGLRDISVRNVSQNKTLAEKYIGNLLVWKTILSIGVYGVLLAVVRLMHYDATTRLAVAILAPSSFLKNMKYTVRLFFQVADRFGWDTVLVVLERILLLGVGLAVLSRWRALIPFTVAFTSVRLLDFLFTLFVLNRKIAPIRPRLDFGFMKRLQLDALPLGLFFLIFTLYSYIDTVMLSKMVRLGDVGQYNAAYRTYEGVTILPTVFWLVILPRLSELFVSDRSAYARLAARSVKAMFVIGIPVAAAGIAGSGWLIHFFFRDAFAPAVATLRILFLAILFEYPNWMLNAVLISASRQKTMLVFGAAGLAVKVAFNAVLIPLLGFHGAAVSTLAGEFAIFTGVFLAIHYKVIRLPLMQTSVKPLALGAAAFAVYWILHGWSVAAGLVFAALLYFTGLFLTGTVEKSEWGALFSGMLAGIRPKS
jgi:O-antigen/teichoic acid export membrane protein